MLIKYLTLSFFLVATFCVHSNEKSIQSHTGDRMIEYQDYIFLADEPGNVACPNVNCDIPVDLHVMKQKYESYDLITKKTVSKNNTSQHSLYQYDSTLIDVYSSRLQNPGEEAYFISHAKAFDITKADEPIFKYDVEIKGDVTDSQAINNKLVMLSNLSSAVNDECLTINSGQEVLNDKSRFYINLSILSMDDPSSIKTYCMDPNVEYTDNPAELKLFSNSVYVTYTSSKNRYVIRYTIKNDELAYHSTFIIPDPIYAKNLSNYIYEKDNVLIILGNYKFERNYQAGMKLIFLDSLGLSGQFLSKNITFSPSDRSIKTTIQNVSNNNDDAWYIAFEKEGSVNSQFISVNTQNAYQPLLSSDTFSMDGYIERIIPEDNDLISVYFSQFIFDSGLYRGVAFLDVSNSFNFHLIQKIYLTEGFTHEALPIQDLRTHASHFDENSGKVVIPSQWVYESNTPNDEGGNKDTPLKLRLELNSFDFYKNENCFSLAESCWTSKRIHKEFLYVPYEGDELVRARSFIEPNGYHYILGSDVQYFQFY